MANGSPGGNRVNNSFGGPNMPVDLANLLVDVSFGGLSEGATGPGISLRWANGMKNGSSFTDIQTGVGINWSLNLTGRVLSLGSDKYVAFFEPTSRGQKFYFTKETDGSFTPDNPCNAELEANSTEYLLKINGIKIVYYKTGGGIKQIVAAGGVVTDYNYDSDDHLEEVLTKRTVGSDYCGKFF